MTSAIHRYPVTILETYLDVFGHMNNGCYLTLFEEARWDLITRHGYGLEKIMQTKLGPVVLEIKLKFLKELRLREEIVIETYLEKHEKKIAVLQQKMVRAGQTCCTAEVTCGLFSIAERKLVSPTPEWMAALGVVS